MGLRTWIYQETGIKLKKIKEKESIPVLEVEMPLEEQEAVPFLTFEEEKRYIQEGVLQLDFETVLDIGFGEGRESLLFADSGKKVDAIGWDIGSYHLPEEVTNHPNINIKEILFEEMDETQAYDLVWMSHMLEHVKNIGFTLEKAQRLLSEKGWLVVIVPPYINPRVADGHLTTGWCVGQLMYVLLVNGFDIKSGHFIRYGYNVCAVVQKAKAPLPSLRHDLGDLTTTKQLWPIPVYTHFDGNIDQVNWFK